MLLRETITTTFKEIGIASNKILENNFIKVILSVALFSALTFYIKTSKIFFNILNKKEEKTNEETKTKHKSSIRKKMSHKAKNSTVKLPSETFEELNCKMNNLYHINLNDCCKKDSFGNAIFSSRDEFEVLFKSFALCDEESPFYGKSYESIVYVDAGSFLFEHEIYGKSHENIAYVDPVSSLSEYTKCQKYSIPKIRNKAIVISSEDFSRTIMEAAKKEFGEDVKVSSVSEEDLNRFKEHIAICKKFLVIKEAYDIGTPNDLRYKVLDVIGPNIYLAYNNNLTQTLRGLRVLCPDYRW